MKLLCVLALVAAVAAESSDFSAPIISSKYDFQPEGSYTWNFETGNNIAAEAQGVLKDAKSQYPSLEVKGAYRYKGADGTPIEVVYVADENGFRPQGAHLPVPPPIPAYIQRSLEYIAAHPPPPSKF